MNTRRPYPPERRTVAELTEFYADRCVICGGETLYGHVENRIHLECINHPEAKEHAGPKSIKSARNRAQHYRRPRRRRHRTRGLVAA